jgi:hypothetical protein
MLQGKIKVDAPFQGASKKEIQPIGNTELDALEAQVHRHLQEGNQIVFIGG